MLYYYLPTKLGTSPPPKKKNNHKSGAKAPRSSILVMKKEIAVEIHANTNTKVIECFPW